MSSVCGTTTAYKRGCRCDACREAQSDYARRYRRGVRLTKGRRPRLIRHGTHNAYVKRKCRCRECRLHWRIYTREQARRTRGYASKGAEHSICAVCGIDFVPKINAQTCSNRCAVKAWRQRRARRKAWLDEPRSDRAGELLVARTDDEIAKAARDNPELADLIAAQERDERTGHLASRHWVSLDATLAEDGSERYETVASDSLDPAVICIQDEEAARIRAVIGYESEEEIQRLDYRTQEWLAGRLREEGLVGSIAVTPVERRRLRAPGRHSGSTVVAAGSFGGRKKRQEKVSANRHSRPSRKPRKRWTRREWESEAA